MIGELKPGAGLRITQVPGMGTSISLGNLGRAFSHPFTVSIAPTQAGAAIRISQGFIIPLNGNVTSYEPRINELKISDARAALEVDGGTANEDGQSWVCVEISPNEDGTVTDKTPFFITHRNAPVLPPGPTGRFPLATLIWRMDLQPRRIRRVIQGPYNNLRYVRTTPASGQGAPLHLFL